MYDGWIKLHRKIIESPVFNNPNLLKLWIWCLCKATHKEREEVVGKQIVKLLPGQFVFGRLRAAETLHMNDRTVYDYMKMLEKLDMIRIDSNNKFSLITIENWAFYQYETSEIQQQNTQQYTIENDTNNNINNIKKSKCTPKACIDNSKEYREAFEIIYKLYPKKVGKTRAFTLYKAWVDKGRKVNGTNYKLTNRQIYKAVQKYVYKQEEAGIDDLQFWKNFDSLMGNNLLDYVEFEE